MRKTLDFTSLGDRGGQPAALLHGWGCDSRFLIPISSMFPTRNLLFFDLPGYGLNADLHFLSSDLNQTARLFYDSIPPNCDVIAWSMGAHPAILAAAMTPHKVRSLTTICSSPRFPGDPAWPGFPFKLIAKCRSLLNPKRTGRLLRLFTKYQMAGNANSRHEQDFMMDLLKDHILPPHEVLKNGIETMLYSDVREPLKHLDIPCLFLFGAKDPLVSSNVAGTPLYNFLTLKGKLKEVFVFENSAHVPFLTEPELFAAKLQDFFDRVNSFEALKTAIC